MSTYIALIQARPTEGMFQTKDEHGKVVEVPFRPRSEPYCWEEYFIADDYGQAVSWAKISVQNWQNRLISRQITLLSVTPKEEEEDPIIEQLRPKWQWLVDVPHLVGIWKRQVSRLIELGLHKELGLSSEEYKLSIPPPHMGVHSELQNFPLLVDGRIGLKGLKLAQMDCLIPLSITYHQGVELPEEAYWIDIQDGTRYSQLSLFEGLTLLKGKGQRPLTLPETIAIAIHYPQIIKNNPIYVGSCYIYGMPSVTGPIGIPILQWDEREKKFSFYPTGSLIVAPNIPTGLPSCEGEFKADLEAYAKRWVI